ncbi:endonuclease/exonuclease/phosphatase family protein [Salegentibacter salegens]|uniref:Metal-dependent hydrolase, endonuclease/exonuclease/phosphatase family n=1 Tax=Salegentibacter salegens TaxID=143223 RepID=A0A1M7NLZ7_9FLAO|nr:endonuclease/exonuclease/phosphatase family protein [Salegentibacter salegens]PRX39161.1 endonuclease/exonuclease/phosphatase family metal-dependent hydrolase [Salegentibacter salegens]SHN04925.1 Metal-dependent hydrolase, endonuclease/exonuclease/phosphatase family [Salegentibacter salegens]
MKFQVYFLIICFFLAFRTTAQDQQNTRDVRILTYNILHGSNTTGDFDLDIIASVINKANPDLVALQEVDFRTARVNKRDILSELAVKTGLTSIFIKAMDYDGGEYGEGILSRTSFIKTENISLPHSPKNEPKAAGLTTLALSSGDTIHFIGTHFDHLPDGIDRMEQAEAINRLTKKLKYPAILAGDLNDMPGSAPIHLLEKSWASTYNKHNPAPTYPSANPKVKIDYVIFYPKNKWKVHKTKVIQDSLASDHNAVLSIIELKKQKKHD